MITVETQEVGTGKWFPIIRYAPAALEQMEHAKEKVELLQHIGLFARITEEVDA